MRFVKVLISRKQLSQVIVGIDDKESPEGIKMMTSRIAEIAKERLSDRDWEDDSGIEIDFIEETQSRFVDGSEVALLDMKVRVP